jgi:hypothetical protein
MDVGKNKTGFFYPPVDPCGIAPVNLDRRGETETSILCTGVSYFARVTVMAVHLLDLDRVEVYEAGAALIALLAYPGPMEEEQREAAHAALCNHALRVKCEREPDWGRSPQSIKPLYALRRPVNRDLQKLRRRLRDRMVAGRMAIGFLQEAVAGRVPELPSGIPRVSINQMARLVMSDAGQTDPGNVETRMWRPSRPVIHIASAFQVFLQLAEPELGRIGLERFLFNRGCVECVLRAAEYHASIIAHSERMPIDSARLVEIRLVERR